MASGSSAILPQGGEAEDPGVPVRDAASVILTRRAALGPLQVLMGQRGAKAAFMPDKYVFPGGAVDPADLALKCDPAIGAATARRLAVATAPEVARALCLTAIRELWEETGLMLGRADPRAKALAGHVPPVWRGFFAEGLVPRTEALTHVFRAVTPPGRPRRFDARFFLADADAISGDVDGFALADGELRHLSWLDLPAARALALPFITEVVLSEIEAIATEPSRGRPVPYFHHTESGSHFRML